MKKRIEIEIETDLKFCGINKVVFAPMFGLNTVMTRPGFRGLHLDKSAKLEKITSNKLILNTHFKLPLASI